MSISRINESIPGMFVLVLVHFTWWFQIWSWNSKMLIFFLIFFLCVQFSTCRLLTPAMWKVFSYKIDIISLKRVRLQVFLSVSNTFKCSELLLKMVRWSCVFIKLNLAVKKKEFWMKRVVQIHTMTVCNKSLKLMLHAMIYRIFRVINLSAKLQPMIHPI